MTIAKNEIFVGVLDELEAYGAYVGDIDEPLRDVLYDLSERGLFLEGTEDLALSDGTYEYTPAETRMALLIDVSLDQKRQLDRIGYKRFKAWLQNQTTPAESEPEEYARFNGKLYFKPVPDGSYTAKLAFWKYHGLSVATIELDDLFRRVIKDGVLAALWGGTLKERSRSALAYRDRYALDYERRLRTHKQNLPAQRSGGAVRYRDI